MEFKISSSSSDNFDNFKDQLDSPSSDEEIQLVLVACMEDQRIKNGRKGRRYMWCDRIEGHDRLYRDYFSSNPTYLPEIFRRRFRMRRKVFLRIQQAVEKFDPYFVQKRCAAGFLELSSLQKITAALRMLAYGVAVDAIDDSLRIGKSTAAKSLKRFCSALINVFGDEYLRAPNSNDVARLLPIGERRSFPGMLGIIDCMHWEWKNCPSAWKGMYAGHVKEPTIILEAVASQDLWIWHANFGMPGYYLADGIYPEWSTFVKTIPLPQGNKKKHFTAAQESARKDVESVFGVLQARFAIVCGPAQFWRPEILEDIMKACVIMHNLIVEDERDNWYNDFTYDSVPEIPEIELSHAEAPDFATYLEPHRVLRCEERHSRLQNDLNEHLWTLNGQQEP